MYKEKEKILKNKLKEYVEYIQAMIFFNIPSGIIATVIFIVLDYNNLSFEDGIIFIIGILLGILFIITFIGFTYFVGKYNFIKRILELNNMEE